MARAVIRARTNPIIVGTGSGPGGARIMATGAGDELAQEYRCDQCAIKYEVPRGQPKRCPLCEAKSTLQDVRARYMQLQSEYEMLERDYTVVRSQVDLTMAMRQAFELCNDDDRGWLKAQLYLYRHDKSVAFRLLHRHQDAMRARGRSRSQAPAEAAEVGFLALFNAGGADEHYCSSVGGMAIAGLFGEAQRTMPQPKAMDTLLRALQQHLSGGVT